MVRQRARRTPAGVLASVYTHGISPSAALAGLVRTLACHGRFLLAYLVLGAWNLVGYVDAGVRRGIAHFHGLSYSDCSVGLLWTANQMSTRPSVRYVSVWRCWFLISWFPLCLAWLFSKCTRSLWDEVGSVEVEKIIIMLLYLFGEDVQQLSDSTTYLIGNSTSSW